MKPNQIKNLALKMREYFASYAEGGAPSFDKFCAGIGMTREQLNELRENTDFDRAYRECSAIRRDFLVDRALEKRFDPSFVKFLLTLEREESEEAAATQLSLRVEVTE